MPGTVSVSSKFLKTEYTKSISLESVQLPYEGQGVALAKLVTKLLVK